MLYDPYESETSPPNSVSSGAVDILTAPPKAPVPLVEMPAPRWICIVPTDEMRSGVSYQYIECESGLFIATPLIVTLRRVGVRAAQADRRAADADARFVGGDHRGGERQHGRNIRAVAVAGDRVVRKIGVGHRRAGRGARGGDFDLLEAVHAYRIALLRVGGHCGDARQNG